MVERRRALRRLALAVVAVATLLALLLALAPPDSPQRAARRALREALGLPKNWATGFFVDAGAHPIVPCPDPARTLVVVTGGQSNAGNHLDQISEPQPDTPDAVMFWNGRCHRLRSPVLGATGTGHSLWPTLAPLLVAHHGGPVLFINGAVGGSQVGDWLDRRSTYLIRLQKTGLEAQALGYRPAFVIWIQGESDAHFKTPPERFVAQLDRVRKAPWFNRLPTWILVRSTYCMGRSGNGPALEAAMASHVRRAADPHLVLGPDASRIPPEMRRDGCHFNARGRTRLAAELFETMKPLMDQGPARLAGLDSPTSRP